MRIRLHVPLKDVSEREVLDGTVEERAREAEAEDVDYDNVVSRHRKFTVEFDRTLAICVDKFNTLVNRTSRRDPVLQALNSAFNIVLSVDRLEALRRDYVSCSHCSNVSHYPVQRPRLDSPREGPLDPADASNTSDEPSTGRERRKSSGTRLRLRNTVQDIFVYPTHNIIRRFWDRRRVTNLVRSNACNMDYIMGNNVSDYIVYTVDGRIDEKPMMQTLLDLTREITTFLSNNLYPLLGIFKISLLVTFAQWLLFIIRLVYCHKHPEITEERASEVFGAFSGTLLKRDFAVYRIFSSTFFHNSGGHLIISTIMHFRFSSVLERIHGATTTLVVYFLSSAYGVLGACWVYPKVLQANGFAGDWGVAGALLSRYFVFPYLIDREHQHVINVFVSLLCLLFAKTIVAAARIRVSTHLLSALAGFCLGSTINHRLRKGRCCGLSSLTVDFLCLFTLLAVPIASVFALFLIETA
ncbi:rhomboid-like peptidase [Babesia caballi]|uniref:Rhomboid-like peptidase n=1 Tax=Babesia caballi TaxID=5871 RepID=A0AAV4M1V2_BABCB|nr:rhomboid-like peptidase [Babesia caballi]